MFSKLCEKQPAVLSKQPIVLSKQPIVSLLGIFEKVETCFGWLTCCQTKTIDCFVQSTDCFVQSIDCFQTECAPVLSAKRLACLRRSEKDLSKQLHVKCQEVVELEARILPLRIRVFELEEAAKASKAKMAGLEKRSINREVQLGCVEAELLPQAKRFEEAEAELTEDAVDAVDA